ncbi:hypothetical protein JTB14_014389 [Gonioctena quinquepunctata]|nr:hypothetical protein JTB14_014389 [Gonioctena quinquepunctata]
MKEPIENLALREGNCSKAIPGGSVFREHIKLLEVPSKPRNRTSSWSGERKIYCILALNQRDASEGSTIFVKEGGVDDTAVTLELHSKEGYALEYRVQVFAI